MRDWRLLSRQAMVAFVAALILGGMTVSLPAEAAPAKKAGIRHTTTAERMSQQEALMLLNNYRNTVQARFNQMLGMYDYKPSLITLGNAFDQGGISPVIKERYLSAWAQNGLYLTWDVVQRFYKEHRDRLDVSIVAMRKRPSISRAEMAQLTDGMTAWTAHEENIARRFNDVVATYVRIAASLESIEGVQKERDQLSRQLSAVPSDRYLSAKSQMQPQFDQLDQREKTLRAEREQWGQREDQTDKWLRDMGYKTRLFVALFAPDTMQTAAGPADLPFEPVRMDTPRPMAVSTSLATLKPTSIKNKTTLWQTNWGPMTLTVKGNKVFGSYPHDKGKLTGVLSPDGKTITAWWSESPSYKGPKDAGKAVFQLSPDARQFNGKWGYGNSLSQGDWTGTRIQK